MDVSVNVSGEVLAARCAGRMDTVGAREVETALRAAWTDAVRHVMLDLAATSYLSSAGLRVILAAHKRVSARGGELALCGVPPYAAQVLEVTGFGDAFPRYAQPADALRHWRQQAEEHNIETDWDRLPVEPLTGGRLRVIQRRIAAPVVKVMGDIADVLHARVTPRQIASKKFFDTEYSIGFGGLGGRLQDYFSIMGEMITVGGTMVWLPTDGQDTPDFLIPKTDRGDVMIRTGYNVSIAGGFQELLEYESQASEGGTIAALYEELFAYARRRATDYRGLLGLAMVADMAAVLGSGIRKSAVADFAPANGKLITDESNIGEWMECDRAPRQQDVTALIVGVGACLRDNLSGYDAAQLNKVFYLHPANVGEKTQLLHNHCVMFKPMPFPARPVDLEDEIRRVVQEGEFLDMRHLLDNSRIRRALIGLACVQAVEADERALAEAGGDTG